MTPEQWTIMQSFVQAFATPLLGIIMFILRRVLQKQDETHRLLREQNGRLTKLETQVADHIQSDKEMFHAIRGELQRITLRQVPPG